MDSPDLEREAERKKKVPADLEGQVQFLVEPEELQASTNEDVKASRCRKFTVS